MDNLERKFVGGVGKVKPENVRDRERANYQAGDILGLNHDFTNQAGVLPHLIHTYHHETTSEERGETLKMIIGRATFLKTYSEWIKGNNITPENTPSAFADDIVPYIESIDEIVAGMKEIAIELTKEYEQHGFSERVDDLLAMLTLSNEYIVQIINNETAKSAAAFALDENLATGPMWLRHLKQSLSEDDVLSNIAARIDHAKKLLAEGPLTRSFSHIRKDGNVLPVDWKPTDQDREALRKKGEKQP